MKNIVNIINFVRFCEPRSDDDSYLFQTTKEELELCKKYNFPSTILLQYDALIDERYTNLINEYINNTEIGLWFEVVKPLTEAVGIEWKGRFPWDWHNDVGFLVGYTTKEKELIIDEAFNKFKEIFGYYPASCGSWHIDIYSLNYMYEKYGISASCNCKEQYGTDGYTIWGGIYSGAYYPSKYNMLCPASTKENQLNVPVFRMLGADPIYQYDMNIGEKNACQQVTSLEPVYGNSGCDEKWVTWYLNENFNNKGISLSYAQVGQENSMGWEAISKGLPMQFEILDKMKKDGKIEIQTLGESGKWFKESFEFTPPQSQMFDSDYNNNRYKTLWYNCKNYRLNVLYEKGRIWIRDLYLFDENFKEKFLTEKETSHNCSYYTLPVIDGLRYSNKNTRAGLYFYRHGNKLKFDAPWRTFEKDNSANIYLDDELKITANENSINIRCNKNNWYMCAVNSASAEVPYISADGKSLKLQFKYYKDECFQYELKIGKGYFKMSENGFMIFPENGMIRIDF